MMSFGDVREQTRNASEDVRADAATVLSVIIPTFNEKDNVALIRAAIGKALKEYRHEVIFVDDDSTDGTLEELRALSRRDRSVRFIQRIGRRGLASAVVEGILSTSSPFVAVIDADLQHDERMLPEMLKLAMSGKAELVVGSRYVEGGGVGTWHASRQAISKFATRLAHLVTRTQLSDPMSGFFVIARPAFDQLVRNLSGQGYKILLDICASSKVPLKTLEVPYQFRERIAGESKLDALVTWEYLLLLVDKSVGHVVPARFISFAAIGGLGLGIHMTVLAILLGTAAASFAVAQAVSTLLSMFFNFFLNNLLTYRDRRLKGFRNICLGLLSFVAVCSVGAVANVGIANYLFSSRAYVWWAAGIAGVLVGAVWNYAVTGLFTWRNK